MIPPPYPSPTTILSTNSANVSRQSDKLEVGGGGSSKFPSKDSFDFEIVEQLINEQQQLSDEVDPNGNTSIRDNISGSQQPEVSDLNEGNLQAQQTVGSIDSSETCPDQQNQSANTAQTSSTNINANDSNLKYRDASSSIKRFDPKFRALTEAFRLKTEEDAKAAAIAAETETDTSSAIDHVNAPSTQDSGIMTQESSQEDPLDDEEGQNDKFYKYIQTPIPSSGSTSTVEGDTPAVSNSHQTNQQSNVDHIRNSNSNIVNIATPSHTLVGSPMIGNNDRYQAYQK